MSEMSTRGGFEASFEAMKAVKNASIWDAISSAEPNPPSQPAQSSAATGEGNGTSPLRILSELADRKPLGAIELHERTGLPFMAFQRALTELMTNGLVDRSDGRVRITNEGMAMLKEFALA